MSIRAYSHPAVLTAALVLAVAAGAQDEQWLQYRSAREASQITGSLYTIQVELSGERPAGVELPSFAGEAPFFGKWSTPMVESGGLWIALDRAAESGLHGLLYIDSDGDGRLDDENPETAYRIDQYNAYFGPVKVVFQVEDGPVTYHLNVRFYGPNANRRLYVSAGGWYEGDIVVGDKKKHCVLLDYNANGTFNDRSPDPQQCDRIGITEKNVANAVFVGRYLEVDGTLYEPEIARDGACVKLAKAADVKYGTVRLAEGVSALSAGGENGQFALKPENGVARLPAGKYRVAEWTLERNDDGGAQWKLRGTASSGFSSFNVSETGEAALEIGEPVVAVVQATAREGTYSFNQSLKGRHGERIELTRNGAQPQAPRLTIRSKDGTYDRTFSFSYG
ncbi:MAG: hypothetical protein JW955_09725 [Sedimentisphaerales bacterium]|nr:hypothetical protein [Sedimentisphaerales bacterium]